MTTESPMTPEGCDLRGLEWMPLYGGRLFGSDFDAHASDAEWRAALQLWWAAWNQVPAASLPDDDVALCRLAGFGRDVKAWRKVKARALYGFTLCTDGRLYHKALAVFALDSWQRRLKDRERKAKYRAQKEQPKDTDGTRTGTGTDHGRDEDRDIPETADEMGWDGTGQDATRRDATSLRVVAPPQPLKAQLISDAWQPSNEVIANLRKGRPDLVGPYFEERMVDFRLWCRDKATTSHDPEAAWFGFMRKSRAAPESKQAQRDTDIEAALERSRSFGA